MNKGAFNSPKSANEFRTIRAMIEIFCKAQHPKQIAGLCPDCTDLLSYARKQLVRCPFQQEKPTCGNCSIHCYKKGMRKKIRDVMRYSGPRMVYHHPIMAFRHLLNSRRKPQPLQKK